MKTETSKNLLAGGSTLAAAVLAGSSAHAAVQVDTLNYVLPDNSSVYFDFGVAPTTTQGTLNFKGTGPVSTEEALYNNYVDTGSMVTFKNQAGVFGPSLEPGDTIDGSTFGSSTEGGADFTPGTSYVSFEVNESGGPGEQYGYLVLTQTGSFDTTTGDSTLVDTINQLVYNDMAGVGLTVEDFVPEPNTDSLLAAAALGAAGLALYRRNRRKQTA